MHEITFEHMTVREAAARYPGSPFTAEMAKTPCLVGFDGEAACVVPYGGLDLDAVEAWEPELREAAIRGIERLRQSRGAGHPQSGLKKTAGVGRFSEKGAS